MTMKPLTFKEELEKPTLSEKIAFYHSFLSKANEQGSEETVSNMLNTANPETRHHMEAFLKSLKDAAKDITQQPSPEQKAAKEQDFNSHEEIISKKSKILLELNREIASVLKTHKKEDQAAGIKDALENAYRTVKADPILIKDKEFITAMQNTAKNLTPSTQQAAGFRVTSSNDTVFSISRSQEKKKVIYPIGEKELTDIISTHLGQVYKQMGVSFDKELLNADACVLAEGRIPLSTQLSAADSIAFVEKTRVMDNELEKLNKSFRSKEIKEEFHSGLKNRTVEMASKEFPEVKKLTDKGVEITCFRGTGTEKMDIIRELVSDLKKAESGVNQDVHKGKALEKAIFNAQQTSDKKLVSALEDFKKSPKVDADKIKLMSDGYSNCLDSVKIHSSDIKTEINLLEKGKRPCCLDENICEIKTNAHHYSMRKSMLEIGETIMDTKLKERFQDKAKSHQHIVGQQKVASEGITIHQN